MTMANQHTGACQATYDTVYRILCATADRGECMPSLNDLAAQVGIGATGVNGYIKRIVAGGKIIIHQKTRFTRAIEIVATGRRTLPSKMPSFTSCIPADKTPWPKRNTTPEGLSAAIGAIGWFEDSLTARRDRGTNGMPPRPSSVTCGGISDVYGSRGIRTGAGASL
jgi:hypothetical protein